MVLTVSLVVIVVMGALLVGAYLTDSRWLAGACVSVGALYIIWLVLRIIIGE